MIRFLPFGLQATLGATLAGCVLTVIGSGSSGQTPETSYPDPLGKYLRQEIQLTPTELAALRSGRVITKLLKTDAKNEIAVFGAVWVEASPSLYVTLLKDIEKFERGGGFLATKRISVPPRLSDFDGLTLPEEDLAALKSCRVRDCEVKVTERVLARIRQEVDWSKTTAKADVLALIRRLALEYVQAYQRGGNRELAVYRDGDRPTFIAEEFRHMIDAMNALRVYLPELQRHLLDYPRFTPPNSSEFFYWQSVDFGLKPTVRINHVIIHDTPTGLAVASKQLYASHYFHTALEVRVLVTDPSRPGGFYFVNVNRSRSDGLTGFVGSLIGGKVRSKTREGLERALTASKTVLEAKARRAN